MENTELLMDLGECDHRPMRPPRADVLGEVVFTECWAQLMAKPGPALEECSNYQLTTILSSSMPTYVTQRQAIVAATFVNWLGTNCGRAFLAEGNRMEKSVCGRSGHGFLMAWAVENHRQTGINSGFRALEHILATDDCRFAGTLARYPSLSADDFEVVEHVIVWLGSAPGQQFINQCEGEIARRMTVKHCAEALERGDYRLVEQYSRKMQDLCVSAEPAPA